MPTGRPGSTPPKIMSLRTTAGAPPLARRQDPSATPPTEENRCESASSNVAGTAVARSSETGRRVRTDVWKSPWTTSVRYVTYWSAATDRAQLAAILLDCPVGRAAAERDPGRVDRLQLAQQEDDRREHDQDDDHLGDAPDDESRTAHSLAPSCRAVASPTRLDKNAISATAAAGATGTHQLDKQEAESLSRHRAELRRRRGRPEPEERQAGEHQDEAADVEARDHQHLGPAPGSRWRNHSRRRGIFASAQPPHADDAAGRLSRPGRSAHTRATRRLTTARSVCQ